MYFINPFRALRPTKENAESVSITSTDHLSKEVVEEHKKKKSLELFKCFWGRK